VSLEKSSKNNNGNNDYHDQSGDKQENQKDIIVDYLLSLPPHGSNISYVAHPTRFWKKI